MKVRVPKKKKDIDNEIEPVSSLEGLINKLEDIDKGNQAYHENILEKLKRSQKLHNNYRSSFRKPAKRKGTHYVRKYLMQGEKEHNFSHRTYKVQKNEHKDQGGKIYPADKFRGNPLRGKTRNWENK